MKITTLNQGYDEWIMVMTSIHGNEIAGKLAAEILLKKKELVKYNYIIVQNINPSDSRLLNGKDLNRSFHKKNKIAQVQKIIRVMDYIGKFKMIIDCHETFEKSSSSARTGKVPDGFYLYEKIKGKGIGDSIIRKLKNQNIKICEHDTIWGEKNRKGVIKYPENNTNEVYKTIDTFENFVHNHNYTDHTIVLESYGEDLFEKRVQSHRIGILEIIKLLS